MHNIGQENICMKETTSIIIITQAWLQYIEQHAMVLTVIPNHAGNRLFMGSYNK